MKNYFNWLINHKGHIASILFAIGLSIGYITQIDRMEIGVLATSLVGLIPCTATIGLIINTIILSKK